MIQPERVYRKSDYLMKQQRHTPREIALAGAFGAAALLLPLLFPVLPLGAIFLPMYLPLMGLAFFVRPVVASTTALLTPLLSGVVSGMPPFYPPIAPIMAVELAVMAALIAAFYRKGRGINEWLLLGAVLVIGRIIFALLAYGVARIFELPAGFVAGISFISGWPGLILMMVVIPPFVRRFRDRPVFAQAT